MQKPDISIIVPAFNESAYISKVLESILEYEKNSIYEIELIIVESGSTDGTSEFVRAFDREGYPWVRCIYEKKPNGKGSACKLGISASMGQCVIIFDADLEYRIQDIDLLAPEILSGKKIVLGSRYGDGPMRVFGQSRLRQAYFNFGHLIFTLYFNLLYNVRLKDPATMWKVIDGQLARSIEFSANRFDFDWELLATLIRLGYIPDEIFISYKSRSPDEGKKIRPLADPFDWLIKILLFRFKKIKFTS